MFRLPGITQPACTGRQLPITRLGLSDGSRKQKPEPTDFPGKSIKQFHPPCSGAISPTPNAAAEFAAEVIQIEPGKPPAITLKCDIRIDGILWCMRVFGKYRAESAGI